MTMLTTITAPSLLVKSVSKNQNSKSWLKKLKARKKYFLLDFPSSDIAEFLLQWLGHALRREEFFVNRLHLDMEVYQVRKDGLSFTLARDNEEFTTSVPSDHQHVARLMGFEELLSLSNLLEASQQMEKV
jgi:hypothetical protein